MTAKEFHEKIRQNKCPFCGNKFKFYDRALGYECLKCEPCGIVIDWDGIHIEEQTEKQETAPQQSEILFLMN